MYKKKLSMMKKKAKPSKGIDKSESVKHGKPVVVKGKTTGTNAAGTFKIPAKSAANVGYAVGIERVEEQGETLHRIFSVEEVLNILNFKLITPKQARELLSIPEEVPEVRGEEHAVDIRSLKHGVIHLYSDGKILFVPKAEMTVKTFEETGMTMTFDAVSLEVEQPAVSKETDEDIPEDEGLDASDSDDAASIDHRSRRVSSYR